MAAGLTPVLADTSPSSSNQDNVKTFGISCCYNSDCFLTVHDAALIDSLQSLEGVQRSLSSLRIALQSSYGAPFPIPSLSNHYMCPGLCPAKNRAGFLAY